MVDTLPSPYVMDLLKLQYEKSIEHGNIIVGTRFTYFVSFATVFFVLMGAYYYIWTSETGPIVLLKPILLFLTSIFGFMSAFVAIIIEKRNIQVLTTCYKFVAKIESGMRITGGIWQKLLDPGIIGTWFSVPVKHSVAIMIFYRSVAIIWIVLIVLSVILLFY